MRLTITTLTDHTFVLEVPDTTVLKTLKEFCAKEFRKQPSDVVIVFDGHPLVGDNKNLRDFRIKDGDFLVMLTKEEIKAAVRQGTAQQVEQLPQRLQEELRRQQQIHENMSSALEHNPEMFGVVHMLYINCKINGFPTKAFVDSGAQTTLMSGPCAKRCNVSHLVDKRFSGVATGVGTQRIIGRIHMVQVQIENDFLVSSFCILQNQPMDVLLGLDMLKRHQCNIDLKRNVLRMGSGTETKFLPENELPQCARNTGGAEVARGSKTRKSINKAIQRSRNEAASTSKGSQNKTNSKK